MTCDRSARTRTEIPPQRKGRLTHVWGGPRSALKRCHHAPCRRHRVSARVGCGGGVQRALPPPNMKFIPHGGYVHAREPYQNRDANAIVTRACTNHGTCSPGIIYGGARELNSSAARTSGGPPNPIQTRKPSHHRLHAKEPHPPTTTTGAVLEGVSYHVQNQPRRRNCGCRGLLQRPASYHKLPSCPELPQAAKLPRLRES